MTETSPLMGGSGKAAASRNNGAARRSSTYRVHEQLDPDRSKPMQYGGKGSRRQRAGFPSAAVMELPTNASQTQLFGRPKDLSTSQAASLLCKYITALFTAVGLFFLVAFSVNNLVNSMTSRGVSG